MNRPPQLKSRQVVERFLRDAEKAWEEQDYQKSIRLVEQATRQEPANPSLLLQLARAHGLRYDFTATAHCIERAVQVSSQPARTLEEAGRVSLELEQVDMAIRYLERASGASGVRMGALMTLADILIRDARGDDAAKVIALATQMDPKDARVLLEQAALRRLRGNTAEAESRLRSLLSNSATGMPVRIRALYELAGILDRSGRYDEAMSTLLEVKAIQRTHAAPYAATLQLIRNRTEEMQQTVTSDVMARWRADAETLQPARRIALLCGHPRSGTTLLEQVLDAHPDVISAEETKIMHDEGYLPIIRDLPEGTSILEALNSASPTLLRHARENYFRAIELFLQKPIGDRLLVDKNPALNIMIPMVVRLFPEAKFLVALRDPRDVILSCFMQALPLTPISSSYLSIESTVEQYVSAMGFWLEMLPRMGQQWMHIRYETMVDDLPTVARATLNFLGVEFDEKVLKFHEHARTKRVRSPSHADVVKPLYGSAVGRWRNYQKHLEPYLGRLERFLKAFGYM